MLYCIMNRRRVLLCNACLCYCMQACLLLICYFIVICLFFVYMLIFVIYCLFVVYLLFVLCIAHYEFIQLRLAFVDYCL